MAFKVLRRGKDTAYAQKVMRGEMSIEQFTDTYHEPGDVLYSGCGLVAVFRSQEEAEDAIDRSIEFGRSKSDVPFLYRAWCEGYEIVETNEKPNV